MQKQDLMVTSPVAKIYVCREAEHKTSMSPAQRGRCDFFSKMGKLSRQVYGVLTFTSLLSCLIRLAYSALRI